MFSFLKCFLWARNCGESSVLHAFPNFKPHTNQLSWEMTLMIPTLEMGTLRLSENMPFFPGCIASTDTNLVQFCLIPQPPCYTTSFVFLIDVCKFSVSAMIFQNLCVIGLHILNLRKPGLHRQMFPKCFTFHVSLLHGLDFHVISLADDFGQTCFWKRL